MYFLGVFLLIFCSVSLIQTCGPPQQGQSGRPGRNGRMGRQGVRGPQGIPGEIGDKGAQGEPGVAGSPEYKWYQKDSIITESMQNEFDF
ncbi:Cuticle collagen dpy-7 [Dirofilaria immitis]